MATKKTTAKKTAPDNSSKSTAQKISSANLIRIKDVFGKFFAMQKFSSILSIAFYIIWIPVGLFFIWFIIANFRLGAFDQLMKKPATAEQNSPQTPSAPAETNVPGVGTVNVDCVQKNLSEESIIKMVQDKGMQNLSEDDKSKLQPCIVEDESSSPEASPQQ